MHHHATEASLIYRSCDRPACADPAVATLSYDYGASTVWVDALAAEPHPMAHDLCDRHADSLTVPRGWQLHDRWSEGPVREPLAS